MKKLLLMTLLMLVLSMSMVLSATTGTIEPDVTPPVAELMQNPVDAGVEITITCEDDVACEASYLWAEGSCEDIAVFAQASAASDTQLQAYDEPLLLTESTSFCYWAVDTSGNVFISEDITIEVNNLCYNGEQDRGEEGVDCGGDCPWDCTADTIEDVPVDDEETESFSYGIGAQVRMKQLLYRVIEHTYTMNAVIPYVEDEQSLENAKVALEYMSELAVEIENFDVTAVTKEEAVEAYVSFKAQAIDYTAKFRAAVQDDIDDDEREMIREAMREVREKDLADLRAEIRMDIREHNKQRVADVLLRLGVEDQDIIDAVLSGEITLGQVRSRLAQRYQELPDERKIEARAQLAERRAEAAALKARARAEIRAEVQQDLTDRRLEQRKKEIALRAQIARENYQAADAVARVHQVNDKFRANAQVRANTGLHAEGVVHRDIATRNSR